MIREEGGDAFLPEDDSNYLLELKGTINKGKT